MFSTLSRQGYPAGFSYWGEKFFLTFSVLCGSLYKLNEYRGVEQLVARRAHNPEVVGSNPSPATSKTACFDEKQAVLIIFQGN